MYREIFRHRLAYFILILGLIIMTLMFMAAWPSRNWQRVVIIALMFFYFLWGIITHVKTNTITKQVMYEYLGVSALGGLLLLLITW